VVVGTANRGGSLLTKRFRVFTNDPKQAQAVLTVTGKVTGYVEVSPERVNLMGHVGEKIEQTVRIIPKKEYPFTIKQAKPRTGQNIRLDLKPLGKNPSQSGYLLTIASTKETPGSFGDYVVIETDLKEKPTFGIPVIGHIYGETAKAK
jgi:hypothetical protein